MDAAYVIPKKELSSWQKWEFSSLDTFRTLQKTESPVQTPQTATPPEQPPEKQTVAEEKPVEQTTIVLPTAEQIEHIYQQAREEGMLAGYQEGKAQGAHEIKVEIQRLQTLISTLEQELEQIDQAVARDLLALSIDLARKITGHTLQVKPELILPVVEHALRQLPAITQSLQLTLHPDDAARVREHLESQLVHAKWHIIEDTQIEPGGCRIEAGGCEVDATLPTRWQRALAPLGQNPHWLE